MRWWIFLSVLVATNVDAAPARGSVRGPTGSVWPATHHWSPELEDEYAAFVARFGAAVEARRCLELNACVADPVANALYDPAVDGNLRLASDCADLPYLLRAYFAFKKRLPFGYVSATRGNGGDARYAVAVRPAAWKTWRDFATPSALFRTIVRDVHSGTYRTVASIETGDVYPVRIDRRSVRPGTIFYDPLGHVSVVARVREDGEVFFVAGSPDGTLTWKRFGSGYVVGRAELGGGFKRWRPQSLRRGKLVRARNAELPDFDGEAQYDVARRVIDDQPATYQDWVRSALRIAPAADPVADFRHQVRALCRDVVDRVAAVELAQRAQLPSRRHPRSLPANIYGALGDWERFASPARDARLKAAVRELRDAALAAQGRPELAGELRAAWDEEKAAPSCRFAYVSSRGESVAFDLDTVLDRLFDLSFDPYHCVELRWGAPAGSVERAACPLDREMLAWYEAEQRLRNRVDREPGGATPLDDGPEVAEDVDPRKALSQPTQVAQKEPR